MKNAKELMESFETVYTNNKHPKGIFKRLKVSFRHEFDYIANIDGKYFGVDLSFKGTSTHTAIDILKYINA